MLFVIKALSLNGGGAERVLAEVASGLAARGHEVTVAGEVREALDRVREMAPALVLASVTDSFDGEGLCRQVKEEAPTIPISARRAKIPLPAFGMDLPSKRMSPESGVSRPFTQRSIVDLPEPDAPKIEITSPVRAVSDTPFRT